MKLHFEVKHDTHHRTWHRMSFTMHNDMAKAENRSKLALIAVQHMEQYAIDHQMNPHQLAVRVVDSNDITLYYRRSNAELNRPGKDGGRNDLTDSETLT